MVTQRIANPCTPVRFRYSPPFKINYLTDFQNLAKAASKHLSKHSVFVLFDFGSLNFTNTLEGVSLRPETKVGGHHKQGQQSDIRNTTRLTFAALKCEATLERKPMKESKPSLPWTDLTDRTRSTPSTIRKLEYHCTSDKRLIYREGLEST